MPTIHEAAQRGDVEALGRELASGVSPNALDSAGWTPLHNLCYNGRDNVEARLACLTALIEAGADIDHRAGAALPNSLILIRDCATPFLRTRPTRTSRK